MYKKISLIAFCLLIVSILTVNAQYAKQDSTYRKCFVGSTVFMLADFITDDDPPGIIQLNLGYRITGKDVVALELKTWKYAWPVGIPFGKSFEADGEKFPGYIREYGVSLNYQRFFWKGLFAQVDVMPAFQTFKNDTGSKIDNGFQIFNTYAIGYHIKLFNDRFFIQPSVAITHRPYHTKMPEPFKQLDDKWSKFFFGQPGLHFGYNF